MSRKVKQNLAPADGFKVDVVPAEKSGIIERKSKPSIYQPILDGMANLRKGQAMRVPIPEGTDPMVVANRLTSVMRNYDVKAPDGMTFRKRPGEGNTLVIVLAVKRESSKPRKVRESSKSK